jgi:hypothetical protein
MSETLRLRQNLQKNIPSDCIICALRPTLYINQINIYQARYFCYHSDPPVRPHFKPSTLLRCLTIVCNLILMYGVINDVNHMEKKFTTKQVVILLEIVFTATSVVFNLIFLAKNKIKLQESHGLMSLFNNKFKFGAEVILTSESAKKVHTILLTLFVFLIVEEVVMFCGALIIENIDKDLLVRMCTVEFFIFTNASLGLYCTQLFYVYEYIFDKCFQDIQKYLEQVSDFSESTVTTSEALRSGAALIDRLRKLQRLYMCLRRNFLLNEQFLYPEILIIFSVDICVLMIGYGYFAVMFAQGAVALLKFDVFIIVKSLAFFLAFSNVCYQAQRVATMVRDSLERISIIKLLLQSQDILSFLFKRPVSKLSALESAQIEMLITTLILQKPQLKASDIFIVGTGFLASVKIHSERNLVTTSVAGLRNHTDIFACGTTVSCVVVQVDKNKNVINKMHSHKLNRNT